MKGVLAYFRTHPWQRRILTLSLAAIAGMLIVPRVYWHIRRDRALAARQASADRALSALDTADPTKQAEAIESAVVLAQEDASFLAMLNDRLRSAEDTQFANIAQVLLRLRLFYTPDRGPAEIERLRRIDFGESLARAAITTAASGKQDLEAPARARIVLDFILHTHDPKQREQLLQLAITDPAASVRRHAAMLAVIAEDDPAIRLLLDDSSPSVRARLMIDLALAGMDRYAGDIADRLDGATDPDVLSAGVFALALMNDKGASTILNSAIAQAESPLLLDKLMYASTFMPPAQVGPAVLEVLGKNVSGMALLAAGQLELGQAGPIVLQTLRVRRGPAAMKHKIALLGAAMGRQLFGPPIDRLGWAIHGVRPVIDALPGRMNRAPSYSIPLPVARLADLLSAVAWRAPFDSALRLLAAGGIADVALRDADRLDTYERRVAIAAAARAARELKLADADELVELIGRHSDPSIPTVLVEAAQSLASALPPLPAGSAYPPRYQQALRTLADAASRVEPPGTSEIGATSLPAAAAAYAAWRIDPAIGIPLIVNAAKSGHTRAGDWLAWKLAQADPAAAERIAEILLNARYSDSARATGALMLAMATRDTGRADASAKLIERLLGPLDAPYPADFTLIETYRCALLLLGRDEHSEHVRGLLWLGTFSYQRILIALLLTGDQAGFDWLLANVSLGEAEVADLLASRPLADVLEAAQPRIPRFHGLADRPVRQWQARIIQDAWLLERAGRLRGANER